ncbi:MAG: hypothetical protein HSCHL_1283 [Hydrogenibacillus schlegelii]|uniref:TadE-like domain-containing protein n=1 Tax=Hydrogenibacillus schlegelii TaxID=1484 RepID=A0A2T5G5W8_HYDSH|nr:TadE family protein [Hydrogenibacillus schlegelii]PTQ51580.1 MAG: hypothetical protein HSCHL_1283 [Hydrogenibacillus schlegelii]
MIGSFLRRFWKDERGQPIVEFALVFPVFLMFLSGLFLWAFWFTGSFILQDATYDAASKYAVEMDVSGAKQRFDFIMKKWGFLFFDLNSVRLDIYREGDRVRAVATGKPKIDRFLFFGVPEIRKEATATLEYRFRSPGEFNRY